MIRARRRAARGSPSAVVGGVAAASPSPAPPPPDAVAPTCVSGQTSTPRRGPRRPRPAVRWPTPPACGAKHGSSAGSSPPPPPSSKPLRAAGGGAVPRPDAAVCSLTAKPYPAPERRLSAAALFFLGPPTASHASMVGGGGGSTAWALAWVRGVTRRRRCYSRLCGRCPRERAQATAPPVVLCFVCRRPLFLGQRSRRGPRQVAAAAVARAECRPWRWEQRKKEGRAPRRAASATQNAGWGLCVRGGAPRRRPAAPTAPTAGLGGVPSAAATDLFDAGRPYSWRHAVNRHY